MLPPPNPKSAGTKYLPELELESPFGRFKAFVLSPHFLTKFKVDKVVISTQVNSSYECNLILMTKLGDFPQLFELLQELKALGFTPAVKCVPGMGDTLRVELIVIDRH